MWFFKVMEEGTAKNRAVGRRVLSRPRVVMVFLVIWRVWWW